MRINLRSLRVRLSLLYVAFMLVSMCCLGVSSYWYLGHALDSSSQATMEKRQQRVLAFINTWPRQDRSMTLVEKLTQLSAGLALTNGIQVYNLDGTRIYSAPGPALYKAGWPNRSCVDPCFEVVHRDGRVIRTLNQVVVLDGQKVRLSMSGVADEHFEVLEIIRDSYLIFCPLLLIASIAGGFALSHRALLPVRRITNKARIIGIQDLQHRLPVPQTGDELQVLAESWNDLLGRLDTAVNRLSQFTGDISHDLRTTITVMLTTAEFALRRRRTEEEYRAALKTIAGECQTTSRLLDDLLATARANILQQKLESDPVNICSVVDDVCANMRASAEVRHQSLRMRRCEDAWTMGDVALLRRLVTILVDNAIKYTPDGGDIAVSVSREGDRIQLRVTDTGIGIPADALPRVFDRFYRVDSSRSQANGSSGLGLAIAKWIAEAHLSTIAIDSAPGMGSTFTVSMPLHVHEYGQTPVDERAVAI